MDPKDLPAEIRHMPIDPRRGLPIPFINERDERGNANFAVLDPRRAIVCYRERLCAMCGLKMGAEVALYGSEHCLEPDGFFIEAPVHEKCMRIALAGVCPFISRETYPRRRIDDPQVAVLGDREKLREVGRSIPKTPALVVIAGAYQMATMWSEDGTMPVYLTRDIVRVLRFGWLDGKAREMLPDGTPVPAPAPEPERTVRRQPRGKKPRSQR